MPTNKEEYFKRHIPRLTPSRSLLATLRLECVNEEFKHYFIVDTPPCSPKRVNKSGRNISLLIKRCKAFFYNLYV